MADSRDDPRIFLLDPDERGVLPLESFHVPRRLQRTVRQDRYQITADTAFEQVVRRCAEPAPDRDRGDTWINDRIVQLYVTLFERGHAHSLEAWDGETLTGGLYGVELGAAFFGESMFSIGRDASKVALVHLVARLRAGGFRLLDTQFITEHLRQFGAVEIPRDVYHARLRRAIDAEARFDQLGSAVPGAGALSILQSSGQTS